MKFEYENTWAFYNELALLPSLNLYFDRVDGFYCLTFHFLSIKVAVSKP
jgi:hypothetical protein